MAVLLTGATGYIGTSVLARLRDRGHEVIALVRSEEKAEAVCATGAEAVLGDATDVDLVTRLVRESDGVIHTAATGDASSASLDTALVEIAAREFAGSERPYVHTGGIWVFGAGDPLTETSPQRPESISGWRIPVEAAVRAAPIRTTIVAPGIVYGRGGGIPAELVEGEEVQLPGDGSQRWALVHVDDLAELYVLAFEAAAEDDYLFGVNDEHTTVRGLAEAAAAGRSVVDETVEESRARLGTAYADALLADQVASAAHARETLGWVPSRPFLVEELRAGYGR